jgi:hypothetical protein
MPVEIKNLSIKVQINTSQREERQAIAEQRQTWNQRELTSLVEKSIKNKNER